MTKTITMPHAQATPPPKPVSEKFVMLTASSEADIQKFIDNLQAAKHSSKITGGIYTAFLPLRDGHILGLEIAVPTERKHT